MLSLPPPLPSPSPLAPHRASSPIGRRLFRGRCGFLLGSGSYQRKNTLAGWLLQADFGGRPLLPSPSLARDWRPPDKARSARASARPMNGQWGALSQMGRPNHWRSHTRQSANRKRSLGARSDPNRTEPIRSDPIGSGRLARPRLAPPISRAPACPSVRPLGYWRLAWAGPAARES